MQVEPGGRGEENAEKDEEEEEEEEAHFLPRPLSLSLSPLSESGEGRRTARREANRRDPVGESVRRESFARPDLQ